MWFWWLVATHALEPGAAKGRFASDCACIEVEPGVHAPDRISRSWLPVPEDEAAEHLVIMQKDALSVVFPELRVSVAERDDVGPTMGRLHVVQPELPYLDNNSRNPCRHIPPGAIEVPELLIFLESSTEWRTDAAAVGEVLKTRRQGLAGCLRGGGEAHVALKVRGSGRIQASIVTSTLDKRGEQCVNTHLAKMTADVSQRAPGVLQFAIVSGR